MKMGYYSSAMSPNIIKYGQLNPTKILYGHSRTIMGYIYVERNQDELVQIGKIKKIGTNLEYITSIKT